MGESTLKTLDDVMFVQGETPVNQENWQRYFGGVLPNGIYEGFAPKTNYEGELVNEITAGVAVYNGLVYRMASSFAVDREVPESEGYRLLSLRIYPDTGVAKLVETRGNAPVSSDETILNEIIRMTQNPVVSGIDSDQNSYVDYRLVYQGHKNSLYKAGVELRQPALMRNGKFPTGWHTYWNGYKTYKTAIQKAILSGNEVHYYVAPRTDWSFEVWLDPMNPPDNAKLVTNAKYVYFHEYPAIVDVARLGSRIDTPEEFYGIKDEFRNIIECFGTNWDRRTITKSSQIYNPPVVWRYHDATPERPFVIQYRGNNGYSQSMFLIQMPTNGASTEWGLVEGTLSNQQDLQEALDAKADATAVYTKTESDTRMYSKAETDALLDTKADAADVYTKTETGEIISDYYTKTESDALLDAKANSADVYDKTETYSKSETDALLDAKADSDNVYAKSETYSKSETDALVSPKANSADVYAKTETYSKSEAYSKSEVDTALGDKANVSSVYTKSQTDTLLSAKEDKSALGTLAYKNSLDATSLSGVLPVAKGGTGVSSNPSLDVNLSINKTANVFLDKEVGVKGVLPITKGGTGASNTQGLVTNLAKSGAGTLFLEDEIGVKGVLPISRGGTGYTIAPTIQTNLGSNTSEPLFGDNTVQPGVYGILPVANGGTGVNSKKAFYNKVFSEEDVYLYVSLEGNDSNDGSNESPFRTIARAIKAIGNRSKGTIQLVYTSDLGQTFLEGDLSFSKASFYRLISPTNTRIIADSISVTTQLMFQDSVRISSISVMNGGVISQTPAGDITLTVDGRIKVLYSSCFLSNVVSNSQDYAFDVCGGILTYKSLTGTFANIGRARNGGIISTGDGHIFS